MKKFLHVSLPVLLLLSGCLTTGDSPSNNKREILFQETWEEARKLVLAAFQAEKMEVTKNGIHDGWVFVIEGKGAEDYMVKVMIFKEENQVSGEVVGEAPEGLTLWGDTPQTSFLSTLKAMSPKVKITLAASNPSEAPAP